MTNPDLDNDGDVDDSDIATALANYTGPGATGKTREQGDTDGDGDVDDTDLGNIFAAYTGALTAPADIDAEQVSSEMAKHGRFDLAGVDLVRGTVEIRSEHAELVCTRGRRPVIEPERDGHGIVNTTHNIERLHVSGIHVRSKYRDLGCGFRFRIGGQDGKYIKRLEIIDCKAEGFDDNYQIVDDWARKHGEHHPGRISMLFGLNISGPCFATDNHSVGLYFEGLADGWEVFQNAFYHSGWADPSDRNKMSHHIYGQRFNGMGYRCDGNVFSAAGANSAQFRAGVLNYRENISSGDSMGPLFMHRGGMIRRNVVLDQLDIQPPDEDGAVDSNSRGHGFILSARDLRVEDNVCARRHGTQARVPAFKDLYKPVSFERNTAVQWHLDDLNFHVDGVMHDQLGTNRTITNDPGVPQFTRISDYLNRERGQAFVPTSGFIDACLKAVA